MELSKVKVNQKQLIRLALITSPLLSLYRISPVYLFSDFIPPQFVESAFSRPVQFLFVAAILSIQTLINWLINLYLLHLEQQ
ncbi:MAG: hypothetical protein AAFV80_24340, partial [Bacteroidota bacterium]